MTLTPDLPIQEDGFTCVHYIARARKRIRERANSGADITAAERAIMDLSYAIDSLAAAFETRCPSGSTPVQMFCSNCGGDQRYAPTNQCGNCGAAWVGVSAERLQQTSWTRFTAGLRQAPTLEPDVEVVELHGMHESQEGVCRWGFALYDHTTGEVLAGPLHRTRGDAERAITANTPPEETT